MTFAPSDDQRAAIEAPGLVFVSAGAGTGKTRVLVERFALAVLERSVAADRICAITYTERAAAELQARIRARLYEAGGTALARTLDGAWISTIHGFCTRILRRYALALGIDPAFLVLDAAGASILRAEAYGTALDRFCGAPENLELVAAYGHSPLHVLIDATHERLRTSGRPLRFPLPEPSALPDRLEALSVEARAVAGLPGRSVSLEEARELAVALQDLLARDPSPAELADLRRFTIRRSVDGATGYVQALAAVEISARDVVYAEVAPMLDRLLALYADEYAARKRAASLLDFDDLQLEVRRLLDTRGDVRDEVRARFSQVMVDEFQDTNELQCAIVDGIAAPGNPLFFVGDEFQSIYRFRHADVDVFRRRLSEARSIPGASAISLRTNFRSRPEVLAVVNHLFDDALGGGFEPLTAGGAFPELAGGAAAVEFLVTASDRAQDAGIEPREAEARTLAARVESIVRAGECRAGDVVLLFSAGTDAAVYEAALEAVGLETVASTSRRYFDAQSVRDLLNYLRLVRNRYDDAALLAVLASPLVGISNDTLALLRKAAVRRALFGAIENGVPSTVGGDDARLLAAFRQRFERLVAFAGRSGIAALIERVIDEHDYDLALMRSDGGARRIANARKLVRMARDFEALRGPDVERFAETVEVRRLAADREPDAPITEEDADAVRLMTIHAAKGLQFPVVIVADAGRASANRGDHLVALPDGRVGIKVPDAAGTLQPTAAYTAADTADKDADADERRRVSYVALTRAVDRLIVSGCVKDGEIERGKTPIGWMLQRLGATLEADVEVAVPGGATVSVRVARAWDADDDPAVDAAAPGQLAQCAPPATLEPLPPPVAIAVPPPLVPLPTVPPEVPGRLSFSSLHLFERCPLRFRAERVLGFRPLARAVREDGVGLSGADLGSAVHDLLEFPDRDPAIVLDRYPRATEEDRGRIGNLVDRYRESATARSLADADVRREVPFLLAVGGGDPPVKLAGRLDLLATTEAGERHVVDYKTNRLVDRDPAELRDTEYHLQEAVYALALLESGAPLVHVHFAMLDADVTLTRTFKTADRDALAGKVAAVVRAAVEGPHPPRPGPVCDDCPVLGLVCAGPDLARLHGPPDEY